MPTTDYVATTPQTNVIASSLPDTSPNHLSPDHAIASSPLIRENGSSPLRFLNDKARVSQASSFRLSKDMATLRWDGSELREDELREEDEDAEFGDQSLQVDSDSDSDLDTQGRTRDEIEAMNHSTLSKRADFILAHAKKKLNVSKAPRVPSSTLMLTNLS